MQAATILPQPYLHLIQNDPYHMALAHLIGKPGYEIYTAFYRAIGENVLGNYLILDNGVIEGDPRPIGELIEKANDISADEIVLPDVFQDKEATLKLSYEAFGHARNVARQNLMAVPQGTTYEEWLSCAKEMLGWGIDTISIPKVVTKMAGSFGRLRALEDLQDLIQMTGVDVHLLGCWETPLELKVIENAVRANKILPVRGVDSVIAYAYARQGLRMSEAERPSGVIDFLAEDVKSIPLLEYNIEMWRSECGALPPEGVSQPRIW